MAVGRRPEPADRPASSLRRRRGWRPIAPRPRLVALSSRSLIARLELLDGQIQLLPTTGRTEGPAQRRQLRLQLLDVQRLGVDLGLQRGGEGPAGSSGSGRKPWPMT